MIEEMEVESGERIDIISEKAYHKVKNDKTITFLFNGTRVIMFFESE